MIRTLVCSLRSESGVESGSVSVASTNPNRQSRRVGSGGFRDQQGQAAVLRHDIALGAQAVAEDGQFVGDVVERFGRMTHQDGGRLGDGVAAGGAGVIGQAVLGALQRHQVAVASGHGCFGERERFVCHDRHPENDREGCACNALVSRHKGVNSGASQVNALAFVCLEMIEFVW